MVSTIITICINVLAFAVGLYIGNIIFGKDTTESQQKPVRDMLEAGHEIPGVVFTQQKRLDSLERKLRDTPMVRTFEFRNDLTKAKLVADVLKPCMVEFYNHWHRITESFKWPDNLEQLADRIIEWYHPESEYTELLLVAHGDGYGSFQVDFTWTKAKPMFICKADAIEGLEHYYKDAK